MKPAIGKLLAHWEASIDDCEVTPLDFYQFAAEAVARRGLPNTHLSLATFHEGGVFSARRIYLSVRHRTLVFDVSASPFGNSLAVSWWLSETAPGLGDLLWELPVIGPFAQRLLSPVTFYHVDTVSAFQRAIHDSIQEVVEQLKSKQAIRGIRSHKERPLLKDFYQS
ncbi:MAG: hypothetical protein ABR568_15000 [Pyrinomonadaceae bacterium]